MRVNQNTAFTAWTIRTLPTSRLTPAQISANGEEGFRIAQAMVGQISGDGIIGIKFLPLRKPGSIRLICSRVEPQDTNVQAKYIFTRDVEKLGNKRDLTFANILYDAAKEAVRVFKQATR